MRENKNIPTPSLQKMGGGGEEEGFFKVIRLMNYTQGKVFFLSPFHSVDETLSASKVFKCFSFVYVWTTLTLLPLSLCNKGITVEDTFCNIRLPTPFHSKTAHTGSARRRTGTRHFRCKRPGSSGSRSPRTTDPSTCE